MKGREVIDSRKKLQQGRKQAVMEARQKVSLWRLTQQEQEELSRRAKASSERMDVVKKSKAILAVADGCSFTEAGKQAGMSREGVSQLVERFNQRGVGVLLIAAGRGRKPTYTSEQQTRILVEMQREPDRKEDQTATWSLSLLQRVLRKSDLPRISRETIREVLHDAGYRYQRTRTWCRTGYALRVRKSGTVTVYDQETPGKKD
jgi:transposase